MSQQPSALETERPAEAERRTALHRARQAPTLGGVIKSFFTHPRETLVRKWNWKSALTSSLIRGSIFFGVNLTASTSAAVAAFMTEFVFRACTSGFYGALTQAFSHVRPVWHGTIGAMLLLPAANHSLEFLVHWLRGTAKLEASIIASICFTALSTLFHVWAMRRGVMIVGEGSQTLRADMRQMPKIIALFVASPFIYCYRLIRQAMSGGRA
jgi:hypothetical protein